MFCCGDYSIRWNARQRAKTPRPASGYSSDDQGIRWLMRCVSQVLLPILLVILALIVGCQKPAAQAPRPPEKVKVMATAYPLADIARQVGGDAVQCDWVAEQGQAMDAIDPTPEVIAKLRNAEL